MSSDKRKVLEQYCRDQLGVEPNGDLVNFLLVYERARDKVIREHQALIEEMGEEEYWKWRKEIDGQ